MGSDDGMTHELERIWKESVAAESRYYPRISLEVLRKTTKNPQSRYPVSKQRFEPVTCRIQV
jgi:hypothetical protein